MKNGKGKPGKTGKSKPKKMSDVLSNKKKEFNKFLKKNPAKGGKTKISAVKSSNTSGFDAAERLIKKSAANGKGRFQRRLKLKDGETAKLLFPKIDKWVPFNHLTHSIKEGKFFKTVVCAGKGCKLCKAGVYASPAFGFPVVDIRKIKYTPKGSNKEKVIENQETILVVRKNSLPLFKSLAKKGKLHKYVIAVTRHGDDVSTLYHPEIEGKLKEKHMELMENFKLNLDEELKAPGLSEQKRLAATAAGIEDEDDFDDDEMEDDDEDLMDDDEDDSSDDDEESDDEDIEDDEEDADEDIDDDEDEDDFDDDEDSDFDDEDADEEDEDFEDDEE